ncbi:BURP domain protein USPL1-like [Silene latifolia]|uniref:BURP domain protein USPL1-like n=1 Tax=Silene latifolia TaxID=37657 RepID=UPI003D785F1F
MHSKFVPWMLAISLLLSMMNCNAMEATPSKENHIQNHPPSVAADHVDHPQLVFFTFKDLHPGNIIPIYQLAINPSTSPRFLPREIADLIPFSLSKLPFILDVFGWPRDSPEAKTIETTLKQCETPPLKGETKYCATSLESMLSFVHKTFGTMKYKPLSTQQAVAQSGNYLQNYTVLEAPRRVYAPKMIACHTTRYPYLVYICHYFVGDNQVFKVKLRSEETGSEMEAVATCHMDTSEWSPDQPFLKAYGIKPGTIPVCHFFPTDNVVWVGIISGDQGSPQI